jgi:hypothetical protein
VSHQAKSSLALLSTAALSLPALAATQPSDAVLSVSTAIYQESEAPKDAVVFGDRERFEVKTNQFYLSAPLGRDWSGSLSYDNEAMSGASPWGTLEGANGQDELIMSGATIDDSRNGVDLSLTRHWRNQSLGLSLGYSGEHDYHSRSVGLAYERDFLKRNTTLGLSASYSTDELSPTDAELFGRITEGSKHSRSLLISLNQLLTPASLINVGLGLTQREGTLSDPYKLRDVRPSKRLERTVSAQYRHYFDWQRLSLAVNYRYFWDSYEVDAHTLDAQLTLGTGSRFEWGPSIRVYGQSAASFYSPYDQYALSLSLPQSSDHRLSSFGAVSLGLRAKIQAGPVSLTARYQHYESHGGLGIRRGNEDHPGLIRFQVFSLGAEHRF